MNKNLHIFIVFLCFYLSSYAQYNENAPWIQNSEHKSSLSKQNVNDLSNSFDSYFKNRDWSVKGSGYKPYKRWENHWQFNTLPDGNIAPPSQLWKAWAEKKQIDSKSDDFSHWTSIGPYTTNVKTGQGRINTFIIDPNNPNIFYAGAPSGGIWKSSNKGVNWEPLSDYLPQIGVSGIAIDPNNSQIIYIVTGDDDARDTYCVGVLKSIDGGKTWNHTGLTFDNPNSSANEIYIHPDNSNILWVGTNQGFYKTKDAGDNWQRKLSGNIRDIKLKPNDPNTIYAVTSSTFWKSTNGGDNFEEIASNLPTRSSRLALEVTPANAKVVYVLSADDENSFQGLYKSTDSGITFNKTLESKDIFGGSKQAWYDMAITVSPVDEDLVFVGVLDIWKSINGGNYFTQINHWWDYSEPTYTHADIHFLRYFNNKLYAGTDGGIYESSDNGSSFVDLTETLNISQYYKIATAKHSVQNIVGGLQDNGGFAYTDNIWHRYHGGDGMDCAIDPNDQNIYYGFSQYGSSLNVTYNGGRTEGLSLTNAPSDEVDGSNDRGGNWVTPLASNKDGVLYAGYSKLYKLNGGNWEAVSGNDFGGDLNNVEISSITNDLIYVSIGNKLYKSIDGGVNFDQIIYGFLNTITSIEINNNNDNIIYVSTGGYFDGGVYRSSDGGENWGNITLNLPSEPKYVIKHQNQSFHNDIFLATSLGVYHFNDKMTEWESFSNNLPNVPVKDLEINVEEQIITAGTYGRGVWQSAIEVVKANDDISLIEIINQKSVQCSGITPKILIQNNGLNTIENITINYSIDTEAFHFEYNGNIPTDAFQEIYLPRSDNVEFGEHELEISISIPNDTYPENNSLKGNFTVNNSSSGQYINTFGDENDDEWLVQTIGSSEGLWEKGITTKTAFLSKKDNAYVTNLTDNYSDETVSYLISPCYDLTALENPILKFDMMFDIEFEWDVLYMEYSTDSGESWVILGSSSDPNWYNSNFIDPQRPITVGSQWTGTDLTLREYQHDLSNLNNESNIIFRFVFASDQASNSDGAIIDNFTIDATAILATEQFDLTNFNVFPNPSHGTFYIQRKSFEEMNLSVYDITGKLVYRKNNITETFYPLNLEKIEKGIYFLKIQQGNNHIAKRLILK